MLQIYTQCAEQLRGLIFEGAEVEIAEPEKVMFSPLFLMIAMRHAGMAPEE